MIRNLLNKSLLLVAMFTATQCAVDDGDSVTKTELGAKVNEYIVPAKRGTIEIDVLAAGTWQADFTDEYDDWAVIENRTNVNDNKLRVAYQTNDYFARKAAIRIYTAERADTVWIKQQGAVEPQLSLPNPNIIVKGAGGTVHTRLVTNIDPEALKVEILYTGGDDADWIRSYHYANGVMVFECDDNPLETPRNARVKLSFTDGWGDTHTATLFQTQANCHEMLGVPVGFDELRGVVGTVIEDLLLEGYIVSNQTMGNAGDVEQTSERTLDYDTAKRTAYIQSLDGKYGFRIICKDQSDNIFEMYSRVSILLKGAEIVRDPDTEVESYTIEGITSNMVASSEVGTKASLTEKKKRISQLTDEDIYTYVTLTDCEFPVRKGSLTPVNEGYTITAKQQRLGKYPLLVRDIEGKNIYLMTNMTCPYRREGRKLPYGSGNLSGVVVHEGFDRMSDSADPATYGDIGRYQLRHQSADDVYSEMKDNFADGFSALAFEMRYVHMENGRALATEEDMEGYVTTTSLYPGAALRTEIGFAALGPVGSAWSGGGSATQDICGITLLQRDGGDSYQTTLAIDNNYGNTGRVSAISANVANPDVKLAPSLATQYTWNYEDTTDGLGGSADGFLVCFSSRGVTAPMSLQIATFNTSQDTPRWWKVEWSEEGTKQSEWHTVGTYTTSVGEAWSGPCLWHLSAPKMNDMALPMEMCDREKVYLRLVPAMNATSNYLQYFNSDMLIENNAAGASGICAIDYIGIRYNK